MAKYAELIPNFLTFVKINTRSDPQSTSIPSSDRETRFLNQLKDRLTKMGLKDVHTNEQSAYVFATHLETSTNPFQPLASFHILIRLILMLKIFNHKLLRIMMAILSLNLMRRVNIRWTPKSFPV